MRKTRCLPLRSRKIFYIIGILVTALLGCQKNNDTTDNNGNPSNPPQSSQSYNVEQVGAKPYGTVYSQIAVQPDGKIVAYKDYVPGDTLRRLLQSGDFDQSFVNSFLLTDDFLSELMVQPDGKILLLGKLSVPGNPSLVRLNSNGQLDESFNKLTGNNNINSMYLQPDGKILVGGSFYYTVGGVERYKMMRLNADGSFDNSFVSPFSGVGGSAMCIAMDTKGRIVVGGNTTLFGDAFGYRDAVRLNSDGSVDATFDYKNRAISPDAGQAGEPSLIRTIAIDKQDRIYLGSNFLQIRSESGVTTAYNQIVRVQTNGTIDVDFKVSDRSKGRVTAILPLENGDVVIGRNYAYAILGIANECISICGSKGEYKNMTWGFDAGYVTDIIQETPQKVLVAGGFINGNSPQFGLFRLTQK